MRKANGPVPTQFALFPAKQQRPVVPVNTSPRLLRLLAKLLRGAADRRSVKEWTEGCGHE